MTGNQINYWNLQENKRHNVATEGETYRHNVVGETETERHNRATENFSMQDLAERSRHNVAEEHLKATDIQLTHSRGMQGLEETQRHNVQSEKATFTGLGESMRHNLETEMLGYTQEAHNYEINTQKVGLDAERLLNEQQSRIDKSVLNQAQIREYNARVEQIKAAIRQKDEELAIKKIGELNKAYATTMKTATDTADIVTDFYNPLK